MPTEQEAKPAVVTPSLQQMEEPIDLPRSAWGRPKWLKEYDRQVLSNGATISKIEKRVGRPRFERLPNVVPVASLTDETDLVSLIRTIVREEVHRLVNQTQESLTPIPNP
ncbi:hypothetical protein TNCV_3929741 [Trichonephila clavipes]|nr:hypothetical protein TNCV_3929741 [Trichonephila clavipes]